MPRLAPLLTALALLLAACLPATLPPGTPGAKRPRVAPSATAPASSPTPPRLEPTLTSIGMPTGAPTVPGTTPSPGSPNAPDTPTALALDIRRFTIAPAEIRPGDSVTLEWDVIGETATLYRLDAMGRLSEFFTVGLNGTLTLPTSPDVRNRVSFILFAASGGATAQAMATAAVICPDVWYFPNPPSACPASPPTSGDAAFEMFERGRMTWLSWSRLIYILYEDGNYPRWSAVQDTWQPGMPESDPGLTPPEGRYQPVRGFGLVWRDETNTYLKVRDRLGWALQPESGFRATMQCDSAPKYISCYLQGPEGEVYTLLPEGSGWQPWDGP